MATPLDPTSARVGVLASVFEAKLQAPRLAACLSRERLYRQIDAAEAPLVVIHADAGYGKTVLVASYLEERGRRSVWYHVGSTDRIPGTFATHICHALARMSPAEKGWHSALASASDPEIAGAFLAGLCNQLDYPVDLVLEDYHRAAADGEIHRVVLALVEHLSPASRIFLLSRVRPNLPTARLTMAKKAMVFSKHDLAFTAEETAALFALRYEQPLAEEELALVMARLEGWAAGLRLTQEILKSSTPGQRERFWACFSDSSMLFDYLAEEVLASLPRSTLDFLWKTSIFAVLNPDLIEEYLPGSGAIGLLQWLAKENLFTTAMSGIGNQFRYHSLFRQVLRRQLTESAGEEAVRQLHKKAATLYGQREEIGYAIAHSLVAGDYRQVRRLFSALVKSQRSDLLLNLMEGWLERAFPDIEGVSGAALLRLLPTSTYEAVLPSLERLAEAPKDSVDPIAQAHAQQRVGTFHFSSGHLDDCLVWLERSRDTFRAAGQRVSASHSSFLLTLAYIFKGTPELADASLSDALALAGNEGTFATINALVAKAELALARHRFREAEGAARASLGVKVPSPVGSSFSLGSLSLALVYQGRGAEAEASALEALARARTAAFPIEIGLAQTRLAIFYRKHDRLEEGRLAADDAIACTRGFDHWLARAMLIRAEIAVAAGEPGAEQLWSDTRRFWKSRGYRMHEAYDGLTAPLLIGRLAEMESPADEPSQPEKAQQPANAARQRAAFSMAPPAGSLVIETLGSFRLRICGVESLPSRWGRTSSRRLFCYLLVNRTRLVPRDELLEAFWPEDDPDQSSNRLWVAVHALRRELAPLSYVVDRRAQGYCLRFPDDTEVDVDRFISLATDGIARRDSRALREAFAVYRGDFLAEHPYDDFIEPERARLRGMQQRVAMSLGQIAEDLADSQDALQWYREAHKTDPFLAQPVHRIMAALVANGEAGAALEAYARYAAELRRELDLDPPEELRQLNEQIMAQARQYR